MSITLPTIERQPPASFRTLTDLARSYERQYEQELHAQEQGEQVSYVEIGTDATAAAESFLADLKTLFNALFPASTPQTLEQTACIIFPSSWNVADNRIRRESEFRALIESTERTVERLKTQVADKHKRSANAHLQLLHDTAYNAAELMTAAEYAVNNHVVNFGMWRSGGVDSWNTFREAQNALHGLSWGRIESQNTAGFLVRQALELRVSETIGVTAVLVNGDPVRANGFLFMDLIKDHVNAGDIVFPVDFEAMRHIIDWANSTVHAGIVPHGWQVEWVLEFLEPLFRPMSSAKRFKMHGAVQFKQDFVDNRATIVEAYLRGKMSRPRIRAADTVNVRFTDVKGDVVK